MIMMTNSLGLINYTKALSYNNYNDLFSGLEALQSFKESSYRGNKTWNPAEYQSQRCF